MDNILKELSRNLHLILPLIILQFGLQIYSIINLIKRKKVRFDNKLLWAVVILLGQLFGSIAYLILRGDEE